MTNYATAVVLALAVGAGAWTITKTRITMPLRVALAKRQGAIWSKLFELLKCPYCTSHWLAFAAVAIWRPWIVSTPWHITWLSVPLQFLVTSFAMIAGSSVVVLVIRKALT